MGFVPFQPFPVTLEAMVHGFKSLFTEDAKGHFFHGNNVLDMKDHCMNFRSDGDDLQGKVGVVKLSNFLLIIINQSDAKTGGNHTTKLSKCINPAKDLKCKI